jgi:CheY-like chemotaxis protein
MTNKSKERQMQDKVPVAVMAVCPRKSFDVPATIENFFWHVESEREALEIMRISQIDLLLVSMDIPEIDVWQFVRKVKMRDSNAKWVLLSKPLDPVQEIHARTLGVVRIFYEMPDMWELYNMATLIKQNRQRCRILT